MICNMKRLIALLVAMTMVLTLVPMTALAALNAAEAIEMLPECHTTTPAENIFKIEGNDTEFILLKTTGDNASKFYVMAMDDAGAHIYDPNGTQRFDPADTNNIAYWLNNEFLREGYNGKTLPKEILDNINYDHLWETEPGHSSGNASTSYYASCGVGIMSVTEIRELYKRFGIRDNIDKGMTALWTRTGNPTGDRSDSVFALAIDEDVCRGNTYQYGSGSYLGVRPTFYLNADFFKKVKVQVPTLGRNVKKAISQTCDEATLKALGYNDSELAMLKDSSMEASERFTISTPGIEEIGGLLEPQNAKFNVTALVAGSSEKEYSIYFECEELGIGKTVAKMAIPPAKETTKTFLLKDIRNGEGTLKVTIKDGERLCTNIEIALKVMPKYENQFMDKYAERSMATDYLTDGQSNSNDTYMLKRAGIKRIHDGASWKTYEAKKGLMDFTKTDAFMQTINENGFDLINIATGNNEEYFKYSPTSSDELTSYINYLSRHFTKYGKFNQMEIWNEPNLRSWTPEANVYDYVRLLKDSSLEMKKYYNETDILGGSINSTDTDYLTKMFEEGAWNYVDYISYHPYINPAKVDTNYRNSLDKFNQIFLDYGGWKEGFVTEVGWPSGPESDGYTPEDAGLEICKMFIVADSMNTRGNSVYTFKDPGNSETDYNQKFGIVTTNATPKDAYYYVSQINHALGGGIYVGEMTLPGNINAHVYMKDHESVICLWTTNEDITSNYDFGEEVTVVDSIGNPVQPVSGNTYEITKQIYYVTGANKTWINKSVAERSNSKITALLDRFEGKLPTDIENSMKSLSNYYTSIASMATLPEEASVASEIATAYAIGDSMLAALKNNQTTLTDTEVSTFLYMLQMANEGLVHLYQASATEMDSEITSAARVDHLYDELYFAAEDEYEGNQAYSNAIFRYARRISTKASDIYNSTESNPSKPGVVKGYETMANELLDWVEQWMQFEDVTSTKFNVEIGRDDRNIYQNSDENLAIGVRSYASQDTSAKFRFYDPDGNLVTESDSFTVAPNGVTKASIPVMVTYDFNGQAALFGYELVAEDGTILDYGHAQYKPKEKVTVSLAPQAGTIEDVHELTVNIQNLFSSSLEGNISIEPCEGWKISSPETSYSLEQGGKTSVTFNVSGTAKRAYNFYTFRVKMTDQNGRDVINTVVPLTFLTAVENTANIEVSGYQGGMEDWTDAYPIFLAPPTDAGDIHSWQSVSVAAMFFLKWDADNFYILANVFDDRHVQTKTGYDIWANDNIQFSLDTKNDKAGNGYAADDFELGAAYTSKGVEVYAWASALGAPAGGSWDPSLASIIRDENKKITRYLMKLPKASITPMELRTGIEFGFNAVVNDSDTETRESFLELSSGTASGGKNPSQYYTFTLVGTQEAGPLSDIETYNLPIETSLDWANSFKQTGGSRYGKDDGSGNTSFDMFTDISGHWAKVDIEDMAKRKIFEGVGDGRFEPNRQITRAEFIAALAKAGMNASEYEGALQDVNADDWYAGYIQTGINAGVIPAEMLVGGIFKPNTPITREEMAAMVVNMYQYKAGKALEEGPSAFADESSFSDWAIPYVNAAYQAGIVTGVDDVVNFEPKASATRAEAVVMVKRLLSKI